jgi:hypothetical protein
LGRLLTKHLYFERLSAVPDPYPLPSPRMGGWAIERGWVAVYSRVAQSDPPTPPPGSLRISPWPQMEGGRSGEGPGRVSVVFYIEKHRQNKANIDPNQGTKSVQINRKLWKSGLADRY